MTESESLDLAALRKLCEAAMPGPWEYGPTSLPAIDGGVAWYTATVLAHGEGRTIFVADTRLADAAFIAAARTAIPVLLDRLEKLEAVARAAWNTLQPFQATGSHADAEMEREIRLRRTELRAALVESSTPPSETT